MPHTALSSFIRDDIDNLQAEHDVWLVPCRTVGELAKSVFAAWRADVVVCWFGSIRYLPLAAAARLLGRPVVIISGGYDVASLPELDYGNMNDPASRALGRLLFRCATRVLSISASAAVEARAHAGVSEHRIRVLPLGLDPTLGDEAPPAEEKESFVLTVGYADMSSIRRKGILTLVRVARRMPDVRFVVAGPATPDALRALQDEAGPNVELLGRVPAERLAALYHAARVYAQPSQHEAFGYSVAEAMLHNCIPVVSRRFSLPEVVGSAGIYVDDPEDLEGWERALRGALALPALREQPRQRVIEKFSRAVRRRKLLQALEHLSDGGQSDTSS